MELAVQGKRLDNPCCDASLMYFMTDKKPLACLLCGCTKISNNFNNLFKSLTKKQKTQQRIQKRPYHILVELEERVELAEEMEQNETVPAKRETLLSLRKVAEQKVAR